MNSRFAIVSVAATLLLLSLVSCSTTQRSNRSQLGWNAKKFFSDPETIALCHAISAHDLSAVEQWVTPTTANALGKQGMTPLLWALTENFPEAVELLLKAGADPHVFVEDDFEARKQGVFKGVAPIHVAAGKEDPVYLKIFLENGADANLKENTVPKESPLFKVINRVKQTKRHIELLKKYDANLNQPRLGTSPPIRAAIHLRRFDVAQILLEAGADSTITTNGDTRLVHLLLRDRIVLSKRTPQQQKHYQALLKWLDENGESIEKAKAEVATGEY